MVQEDIKYCPPPENNEKSFYFDHVRIFWNEQITYHQAEDWELSYIIKGSGTRVLGDTVETFLSGEVILLPPKMPHGWYFNEFDHDEQGKIENITIIFSKKLLYNLSNIFPELTATVQTLNTCQKALTFGGHTLKKLQVKITEMLSQTNAEQIASFINLLSIISNFKDTKAVGHFNKRNKTAVKMQDISRFMVHNYQRKITLDEIAKYVNMNRSSFCTFFKREKGKSFLTALNEYRIECSCLMLRETNMAVTDICYSVGFDDVPYFNRTFRKLKGETPKNFRASALVNSPNYH
jgi:YesN/AraC family two-component response regulator